MVNNDVKEIAIHATRLVCELCRNIQEKISCCLMLTKHDSSPVTIADYCSQTIISYYLTQHFPNIPIIAEEELTFLDEFSHVQFKEEILKAVSTVIPDFSEETMRYSLSNCTQQTDHSCFWVLDPIDGTKGFMRGQQYAISLALIENGKVVFGILGCPNFSSTQGGEYEKGSLFIAEYHKGTSMLPLVGGANVKINTSNTKSMLQAVICESVESSHSSHILSQKICQKLGITEPPKRIDSQCKYAAIATGLADIYLRLPSCADYYEKIWDHAAGYLLVLEAGGQVTDIMGHPIDFSRGRTLKRNKGIVATNGLLHKQVIEVINDNFE